MSGASGPRAAPASSEEDNTRGSKAAQALIIGTLAAMLATSLPVIRFLANPYHSGYGSLKPTEMSHVLGQVEQATKILRLPVERLCDQEGRPLSS